jgi:hypothetical protein
MSTKCRNSETGHHRQGPAAPDGRVFCLSCGQPLLRASDGLRPRRLSPSATCGLRPRGPEGATPKGEEVGSTHGENRGPQAHPSMCLFCLLVLACMVAATVLFLVLFEHKDLLGW